MIDHELEHLSRLIAGAKTPEDVFGKLDGDPTEQLAAARRLFRKFSRVLHPDKYQEEESKTVAQEAYGVFANLWTAAQERINNGIYGASHAASPKADPVRVSTRKREYTVGSLLAEGDICNLYNCSFTVNGDVTPGIFKVARDPADNDLVSNEARILRLLRQGDEFKKFHPYVPELIESFGYKEAAFGVRQANVLTYSDGLYSLKEITDHYTDGIDSKDMAWMWRRLLVSLGFAHKQGVIHGAVLPTHILIHPEKHGLVLVDWSYAVHDPATTGERISAISADYEDWYPSEVMDKEMPLPGLDIFMAAACMVSALGGDPLAGTIPDKVPQPLRAFLRGCMLKGPRQRPQDAWKLLEEFDELLERIWGRRRFHHFSMPPRK